MLTNKQKAQIGMYKTAAKLKDKSYRELLNRVAQVNSTTDPKMTNANFDELMRRLEAILELRVINGVVPKPTNRIQDLKYWRGRNPGRAEINSRMIWEINQLWDKLRPTLDQEKQNNWYLMSMAGHATTKFIKRLEDMHLWQANLLVEALKDRLHYANIVEPNLEVPQPQQKELDF